MTLPSVTIADIIQLVKDYARNQNLIESRIIRNINAATDLVMTELGLPSAEKEYYFWFDHEQLTYALPEDFGEVLALRYADDQLNAGKFFSYKPPEYLYRKAKLVTTDSRYYGVDSASGAWRLWVLSLNSTASALVDDFDFSAANWTASNDATNVTNDAYTYKEGNGSMSFDIVPGLSVLNRATLKAAPSATDWTSYLNKGIFKVWFYMPNITDFTSATFQWGSGASAYYTQTVTTQADGTAFVIGWNQLAFNWSGATPVGSPDLNQIDYLVFNFDYDPAFTGGSNFRLDYLRIAVPDQMILNYYTRFKGQDSGGSDIYDFTANDDILPIATFDLAIRNLIAIYAAVMINPQLLVDDTWVQDQYKFFYQMLSRKYPRKRFINLLVEPATPITD